MDNEKVLQYIDEDFGVFEAIEEEEIATIFDVDGMPVQLRIAVSENNLEQWKCAIEHYKKHMKKLGIFDIKEFEKKYRQVIVDDTFESAVDWSSDTERPIKTKQEYSDRIYMGTISYAKHDLTTDDDNAFMQIQFYERDEDDDIFCDEWMIVNHFLYSGRLEGTIQ